MLTDIGANLTHLTAATVHDDSPSIDMLSGGTENDWFFARTQVATQDLVLDRALAEVLDEI